MSRKNRWLHSVTMSQKRELQIIKSWLTLHLNSRSNALKLNIPIEKSIFPTVSSSMIVLTIPFHVPFLSGDPHPLSGDLFITYVKFESSCMYLRAFIITPPYGSAGDSGFEELNWKNIPQFSATRVIWRLHKAHLLALASTGCKVTTPINKRTAYTLGNMTLEWKTQWN